MKICILSNKGSRLDEGQRNVAESLAQELSKHEDVIHYNAKIAFKSGKLWREIRKFNPDIIHFFLRPNFRTFYFAWLCKIYLPNVKTVFSVLQPVVNTLKVSKYLTRKLLPDCIMTLTVTTAKLFVNIGGNVHIMRIGVDYSRFHPVSREEKIELRKKYDIAPDKTVVLHVGHLTKKRNLDVLVNSDIKKSNHMLLIIASPLFRADKSVTKLLVSRGAIVVQKYFDKIHEIYQLSDLYVFPTLSGSHAIEAPLSVFEAVATNLPVITTRFGILPDYFNPSYGLQYVNSLEEFPKIIAEMIMRKSNNINVREKVIDYSWERAARELLRVYERINENE